MAKTHLKIVGDSSREISIKMRGIEVWFGESCVVKCKEINIPAKGVTCLVGPSGSGKSTLLRSLNRINDDVSGYKMNGKILIDDQCIHEGFADITHLRAKVGMVFQKPCVFPGSIKENVLFGVRDKKMDKRARAALAEESLKAAAIWKEVAHRLDSPASTLSLGQQQRLCIARALAVKPDILLLDEPTASVDPVTARALEDLISELKSEYTIIMVTHDLRQTKRIADHVVFVCDGELIETGTSDHMFSKSSKVKTRTYLSEEFCDC